MRELVEKGALSWEEINESLRARAADHLKIMGGRDRPQAHRNEAETHARGIMDAHRTLYGRALREGRNGRRPSRPPMDATQALQEALHPADWHYMGKGDPIAMVITRLHEAGWEFVRVVDMKEGERLALPLESTVRLEAP